jgi:hypothetical protein
MKGVKTLSAAHTSSTKIHSDHIEARKIVIKGIDVLDSLNTLLEDNKKLNASVSELTKKLTETETKLNTFEVAE